MKWRDLQMKWAKMMNTQWINLKRQALQELYPENQEKNAPFN